jgi:hypothetical protein
VSRQNETVSDAYMAERLCQRQWRAVLRSVADEFNEHLSTKELADMFVRIGGRFARSNPLAAGETLEDLAARMNGLWSSMDWGVVSLIAEDDHLVVRHQFSPLTSGFGFASADWAGAFLLGIYRQWLEDAGSGDDLVLDAITSVDEWGSIEFHLGAEAS